MNGWDLQADKAEYFEILENMENEYSDDGARREWNRQEYVNAEFEPSRNIADSNSQEAAAIQIEALETDCRWRQRARNG